MRKDRPNVEFSTKKRSVDLMLVLALWHELTVEWGPNHVDPLCMPMRRRQTKDVLSIYLHSAEWPHVPRKYAERAWGFEIVLRLASGQIDLMHSTEQFFSRADNGRWFRKLDLPGNTPSATFKGVELTPEAVAVWHSVAEVNRQHALAEARRLLESDRESQEIAVALLPKRELTHTALRPHAAAHVSRKQYLEALVKCVHEEAFQPIYRKRPFGAAINGWDARLRAYFWPAPEFGYRETCLNMEAMTGMSRQLAEALDQGPWNEDEQRQSIQLAHAIFEWGGVPQDADSVTAHTVQQVYRAAIGNNDAAKASMNSGWTKVGAFATAHLENIPRGQPQAIWDSRVATSIIYRLDGLLPEGVALDTLFPGVGTVPGRGGTRPRELWRRWPSGYRTWAGQVAGSQLVREIRDLVNGGGYPQMPLPQGGTGMWTTRGIEMVLFMDGY